MYTKERSQALIQKTQSLLESASRTVSTDHKKAREWAEALQEVLPYHDYRYYVLADPVISDSEYDTLFAFLQKVEKQHPDLQTAHSPTQRIPAGITKAFPQADHLVPMLSLANSYNRENLLDFDSRVRKRTGATRITYTAEPKFDGTGISLVYIGDALQRAVTRGDGATGEDITPNIRLFKSVPLKAAFSALNIHTIEIRGEVLMGKAEFKRLNKQKTEAGETPFANPRNATAGTLRLQDSREVAKRNLVVFSYHISYARDRDGNNLLGTKLTDYLGNIGALSELGFLTPYRSMRASDNIDDILEFCREWEEKRDGYEYEVDGMVIKVNDLSLYETLGSTSHHPRWAMAYKFKARQGTSKLERVEFQVGRVGNITPVAKITPVQIGGVTVSSVSMFNEDFIEEKDIRLGDRVLVERAGDVIPYIVKPITDARNGQEAPIRFPDHCPSCGKALIKPEQENLRRCINAACPAQSLHKLIHFVSKDAMDIDGMGASIVKRFNDLGLLERIPDIYKLDYEQIEQLEGFGKKSVENLKQSVEASKSRPLHLLLYGLGIRFVGKTMARNLAAQVECIEAFFTWEPSDYEALHDAGPRLAESMAAFFHNPDNQAMLNELKECGVKTCHDPEDIQTEQGTTLEGKTFLFTGGLETMKRKEAADKVEALGGKVVSSVSRNLDYLVAGKDAGSKLKKAQSLPEVTIIDEEMFLELTGQ